MKKCPKCKVNKPTSEFYKDNTRLDRLSSYCKPCHVDYYSTRNKNKARLEYLNQYMKEYRLKNPEKIRARGKVQKAIKSGKLVRLPCEECGDPKSEAHHEDHTKPLDVMWLCFTHHRIKEGRSLII